MEQIKFEYGDERWSLYKIKINEIVTRKSNFKINQRRQRKYLFNDIPGSKGHMWQREIFDTLLAGQPIPLIELNVIDELNKSIEDGQQRLKTTQAIIDDCVQVSPNVIKYGKDYDEYIGYHFGELPQEFQDKILNTDLLVQCSKELTEAELHQRFLKINDGNSLSNQDKRSSMINDGAGYLQTLVDKPKYRMFNVVNINDKIQHQYTSVSIKGRELEEVVAHWFNYCYDSDSFKLGQPNLWKLYQVDFEDEKFPLDRISKKFEKYLKKLDIALRSFNKSELVGKKIMFISFIILKKMTDEGMKIDTDTFFNHLTSSVTALKQADKLVKFKNRGKMEKMNFSQLFRLASTLEAIETVIQLVVDKMVKMGPYMTTDIKRSYSKEERHGKWVEQDKCCGYCRESVEFEHSVADHKVPHSEGGETTYDNLTVSCKRCNGMKSNLPYESWMQVLPTLTIYDYSNTSSLEG